MSDVDVDKAFNSLTDALSILMDLGNFPLHTNKLAEAIPVLRASLTATQEKLAAAERTVEALRLNLSAALKSTPAPDQSARELTDFMEWLAHNNWLSIVLTEDFTAQSIVNVYRVQRLDAFNTQDNSNE